MKRIIQKDLYSGPICIHFYTYAFKMPVRNNKILW